MKFPEKYRHFHPNIPIEPGAPGGYFRVPHNKIKSYFFNCIAGPGYNWEHAACTVWSPEKKVKRCPTWEEMCYMKDLFWDEEEEVMQLHPPKSEWISNHPYCLHLWRPVNTWIPLPPSRMVGVRLLLLFLIFSCSCTTVKTSQIAYQGLRLIGPTSISPAQPHVGNLPRCNR
jgi:hypothetical protein